MQDFENKKLRIFLKFFLLFNFYDFKLNLKMYFVLPLNLFIKLKLILKYWGSISNFYLREI